MKLFALAFTAAAATLALTACSHSTPPPAKAAAPPTRAAAAPTAPGTATATQPVSPASCRQQYTTWQEGPGQAIFAAVNAIDAAVTAKDSAALTSELKTAGPAAVKASQHPIPACADPKGYWLTLMMHINAAASSGSKSGASALSALQTVPTVKSQFTAELKQTTG